MIFTDKVLEFSENISFRFSDKEQTFECGFPIKAVIWTEEGTSDESSIGSCVFSSFLLYVYLGASITWAKSSPTCLRETLWDHLNGTCWLSFQILRCSVRASHWYPQPVTSLADTRLAYHKNRVRLKKTASQRLSEWSLKFKITDTCDHIHTLQMLYISVNKVHPFRGT